MAIEVKFTAVTAVCDKCNARSSIISICGNAVKLPDGWVHTSSIGVLCPDCQKKIKAKTKFKFCIERSGVYE